MQVFNSLLIGEDGNIKSFTQFRDDVARTGTLFNKTYLKTEYNTALSSAQMAQKWDEFAEDDILQYSTVGDDRVRPAHALLDGTTAPKTDAVWQRIWPPLDWECRCTIIHGISSNVKKHNTRQLIKDARIPPQFQNNSGITKTIFDKENIYYQDSFNEDRELRAEVNYGMPSVPKIYADNGFPAPKKLETKDQANDWWTKKAGTQRGSFDVTDRLGTVIRLDNDSRIHIFEQNNEGRYVDVQNIEDILADPDEIWSIRENDVLKTKYIKYYEDYPYVVEVDGIRAYTMYSYEKGGKLNEASIKRDRRGILLFRKN